MNHSSAAFISDLHLHAATPKTLAAFEAFCLQQAPHFAALYVLGDLFEAYIGDDDLLSPINQRIVQALRKLSDSGTMVYFMHGNRDFLAGEGFANASAAILLPDPVVHSIAGVELLISHGDAWCLEDVEYQQFRQQSRSAAWRTAFLSQALPQRREIARTMRMQSQAAKKQKSVEIMDVHLPAVLQAAKAARVNIVLHGHTHRSAMHQHPLLHDSPAASGSYTSSISRIVLSDWDFESAQPRGNALIIDATGPRFIQVP